MSSDSRKPSTLRLDADFIESARARIDLVRIIDKLNAHVMNPYLTPMSKTQLTAAFGLLRKVMPDLQSIEHTGMPKNPLESMSSADIIATIEAARAALATGEGTRTPPTIQ